MGTGESGGTEEVAGGVITGGTGKPDDRYGDSGGGVYVGDNASAHYERRQHCRLPGYPRRLSGGRGRVSQLLPMRPLR